MTVKKIRSCDTSETSNDMASSAWADLPKELVQGIGKYLDSRVDVLRFRAVCSSWRAKTPALAFGEEDIPPVILNLPYPLASESILSITTMCCLEILHQDPAFSASQSKACWLTEVGNSGRGQLQFLHPLTHHEITQSPIELNLLDFRFVPLSKAFTVELRDGFSVSGVNKLVLFPVSVDCCKDEFGVLAIYHGGKLGYWKYGDTEWILLDDRNFQYDDIIEYKGQFYVVDRQGTVYWIDSSLKLIQYSPPLCGCGEKKNLVESCGKLYVVDRYLDRRRVSENSAADGHENSDLDASHRKAIPKAIDFRVYVLDEDLGWVDVKSLEDRVFFLGTDCSFSVSSRGLYGGRANCIYFTDDDDNSDGMGLTDASIGVFQLEDSMIQRPITSPEYRDVFWPPQLRSK